MASSTTSQPASTTSAAPTESCTTAVPGKYGNVPFDACNSYYNFNPEFAPAVAVAVIFGLITVAHVALAVVFKKRYCWVIIMGATWETIAFILHALGAHDQQNVGYATAHQLLYLLAPLWINAYAYMTFARMVHFFLPEQRIWRVKGVSLAKYFVWADIVSFLVQAVGGLMASPGAGADTIRIGINVYMGGMGLQEAFILVFIGLMIKFHRRGIALDVCGMAPRQYNWRPLLYALYGALVSITVRIIYRICEFAGGVKPSNPIPFHEAYSYSLDAFPMMVAMLLLVVFHPGRSLVGPESEFPRLSRKEKKAAKKEKKAAKKADKEAKRQKPLQSSSENLQEDVEGQVTPPQASYEESRRYYAMEVEEEPRR
ncbi:putative rta1 domain protein [Neofusicoccum parvum UCRNP2]|uniref:Putative rta1 domain protein n=1 Tax=Botryosphaeria parva (strain UCR-NP2) TaxID=1287680 RepID=R1GIZ7_BOTPV|nr:putative rta1 domain protein [Neofusicoccum parvum UCRNP2]